MMIDLNIVGINDPRQGVAIKDAVENAMLTLMPKREKPIYINVEIGLDEDMGAAVGFMIEGGEPDEFDMFLRKDILNDMEELIVTVTHECVHIKQYLRKELGMDGVTWKGEDTTDVEYMDNPSEIEAYDLQEKLYAKCVDLKVV